MRLAISNIGFAPGDDETVYAEMSRCGFSGLEAAPTRLAARPCRAPATGAKVAAALRARYGFFIPSMQSIWYGLQGNIFVPEDAARLARYTARIVDFAAAAGCPAWCSAARVRDISPGACARTTRWAFLRASAPMHACMAFQLLWRRTRRFTEQISATSALRPSPSRGKCPVLR